MKNNSKIKKKSKNADLKTDEGITISKQENTDINVDIIEYENNPGEMNAISFRQHSQNEDLNNAAGNLLDKYTELYEFSPVGYLTLDRNGIICEVNLTGASLIGTERPNLLNKKFSEYLLGNSVEIYNKFFKNVFEKRLKLSCEVVLQKQNNQIVILSINGISIENGKKCFLVLNDITELKKLNDQSKSERQRLFDVLETLPSYVALLSPDYHVPFSNKYFRENFGESHGRRCYEYLFNRTEPCEVCETYKVLKTMKPLNWKWTGPNNRNYDIYDFPFTDTDGTTLILEMGIDITEQKIAEEKYLRLNSELEDRVIQRTSEIENINSELIKSRMAALNLMEDANKAREQIEQLYSELMRSSELKLLALNAGKLGTFSFDIIKGEVTLDDRSRELLGISENEKPEFDELWSLVSNDEKIEISDRAGIIENPEYKGEYESEHRIILEDKSVRWLYVKSQILFELDGNTNRAISMVGVISDITERKNFEEELRKSRDELEIKVKERTSELQLKTDELWHSNRALRTISACNQVMIHSQTEEELVKEICSVIVKESGYKMAWIGLAENDKNKTVRPVAFSGFEEGYLEKAKITWADTERGRGPTGIAIRTGQPTICQNMQTDPRFKPWREEALKRGYSASIVLPLKENGVTFGAISIYATDVEAFNKEEVNLLTELSEDLSFGLLVLRNSIEKRKAEEKAAESYKLYRIIFENSEEGMFLTSPDGRILDSNPSGTRIFGYSREEFIAIGRSGLLDTSDPRLSEYLERRQKYGHATGELAFIRKDGRKIECEVTSRIFYNEKGEEFTSMILRDVTEKKRTQQQLINREKELSTLFDILPVGISVVDDNRNVIRTNPAFNKIFEIPDEKKSDVIHLNRKYLRGDLTIMPASEFPSIMALERKEKVEEKEVGVLKEDGKLMWVSVSAAPLARDSVVVVSTDVTERRNAEKIIKDSESNLKLAQKLAKIGSFRYNVDTGKINWSDEMYNIVGRKKEKGEPTLEELSKYFTAEGWIIYESLIKNAIENGEDYNKEFRYTSEDKKKKGWINIIGKVSKDSTGKVFEVNGTVQDITERKVVMQELNKLNAEILDLYNNAPCGYHSLDNNGNILRMNNTELKWLGYSRDEIVGKLNIADIQTEDTNKKFKKNYPVFKKTGKLDNLEMEFKRKDGSVFCVSVNSTAVYDKEGSYMYSRSSIFDITARKEAEKKLEQSSKNWSDTFKAIKDHIWLLDKNGYIIQSNNSAKESFCGACEEEVGQKCYSLMHNTKTFIHECPFTAMHVSKKREVREQTRNGKIYSVTVDPIYNEKNEFIGAVHIMSDITKLKEAENQMRDFAIHLQRAREEERTALSRTLHDNFGQQLTGLKMEVSSLEKKLSKIIDINNHPELPEKFKSMKSILDDSVALTSKISMELRPNVLDMLGLVAAVEWLGKDFSEKSGIECEVEKKTESIEINPRYSTEVFRIMQEALTNIVRHANATKVKIILLEDVDGYTVTVIDNGRGIREEEKKSPYSLGLLGMKERAMIFKGTVEISGKTKKGTELIIKIPNNIL